MFDKVLVTVWERAELFGKELPLHHEKSLPVVDSGSGKTEAPHRRCSSYACRAALTSAEISLLIRPIADPLENTVY